MKRSGIICIILGFCLLLGAAGLAVHNEQEAAQAEIAVRETMPVLVQTIQARQPKEIPMTIEELPSPEEERSLPVVEIDGRGYVGFLTIPALELELPVLAQWSESLLKISPCLYAGDYYTDDLVIMAHNYTEHFGRLHNLRTGDTVIFTDMDANATEYTVQALDILQPADVEEMTAGTYDLTLFTCTATGNTRVTVRCDRT